MILTHALRVVKEGPQPGPEINENSKRHDDHEGVAVREEEPIPAEFIMFDTESSFSMQNSSFLIHNSSFLVQSFSFLLTSWRRHGPVETQHKQVCQRDPYHRRTGEVSGYGRFGLFYIILHHFEYKIHHFCIQNSSSLYKVHHFQYKICRLQCPRTRRLPLSKPSGSKHL